MKTASSNNTQSLQSSERKQMTPVLTRILLPVITTPVYLYEIRPGKKNPRSTAVGTVDQAYFGDTGGRTRARRGYSLRLTRLSSAPLTRLHCVPRRYRKLPPLPRPGRYDRCPCTHLRRNNWRHTPPKPAGLRRPATLPLAECPPHTGRV